MIGAIFMKFGRAPAMMSVRIASMSVPDKTNALAPSVSRP